MSLCVCMGLLFPDFLPVYLLYFTLPLHLITAADNNSVKKGASGFIPHLAFWLHCDAPWALHNHYAFYNHSFIVTIAGYWLWLPYLDASQPWYYNQRELRVPHLSSALKDSCSLASIYRLYHKAISLLWFQAGLLWSRTRKRKWREGVVMRGCRGRRKSRRNVIAPYRKSAWNAVLRNDGPKEKMNGGRGR